MAKFISRAIDGAGKVLEKGVKIADDVIDGPITDGMKKASDRVSNITERIPKSTEREDPMQVLKRKYVMGEITREQFLEMKADLNLEP